MDLDPPNPPSLILNYAPRYQYPRATDPIRVDKYLVVATETSLPPRCILCNTPTADTPESVRLDIPSNYQWGDPMKLTLKNPTVVVHAHYCPRHRRRRTIARYWLNVLVCISLVLSLATILCRFVADDRGLTAFAVLCVPCIILAFIARFFAVRGLNVHYVKDGYAYLTGPCPAFMRSLPTPNLSTHPEP